MEHVGLTVAFRFRFENIPSHRPFVRFIRSRSRLVSHHDAPRRSVFLAALLRDAASAVFHSPRRASFRRASFRAAARAMAASSADAPAFTLAYFDVLALGLPTGMVAAHSGLPWRGKDPETFDWRKVKQEEAPFNQLPLLFRPGKRTVAHSAAIARAIAAMAHDAGARPGYDGSSHEDDAVVSDILIAEALDVYAALQKGQPTCFVKMGDGGKTEQAHDELWSDTGKMSLRRHFVCLEKLVRDTSPSAGWFSSARTAGEFFLWGVLRQVVLLDAAALDATPKLKAFYETVSALPETRPLIEGTSPMGAMKQYFVAGPRQTT